MSTHGDNEAPPVTSHNADIIERSHVTDTPRARRAVHVALALVIAVAATGYFVGLDDGAPPMQPVDSVVAPGAEESGAHPADAAVPAVVDYRRMGESPAGANRNWRSELTAPAPSNAAIFEPVAFDEAARAAAVVKRNARRAYNGAPPVIPHPIDAMAVSSCTTCHASGLRLGNVTAPKISHPLYSNCTQCHAPAARPEFLDREPPAASFFVGISAPLGGDRAWPGAPPVIPHTTFMRENCNSCHGPTGLAGIRTTHAWRTNCTQCHAPSAKLDGYDFRHELSPGNAAPRSQ